MSYQTHINKQLLTHLLASPCEYAYTNTSVFRDKAPDLLIAEYNTLRDEILKRTELQHQILSLAIIAFGTLIPLGIQISITIILVYPILGLFLAAIWLLQDLRIQQIGAYIRNNIEKVFLPPSTGWEHRRVNGRLTGPFTVLILSSSRAIFLGTQTLAIGTAFVSQIHSSSIFLFILIDIMIVFVTVVLLRRGNLRIDHIQE